MSCYGDALNGDFVKPSWKTLLRAPLYTSPTTVNQLTARLPAPSDIYFTAEGGGVESIAMTEYVCLSVCPLA